MNLIDLRYNPGGRITTSINFASMITGQFNNQIFAQKMEFKINELLG